MPKKLSAKWLREKAAIEDKSLLSVGGLVEQLKTCKEIKAEHTAAWDAVYDRYRTDMAAAKAREFPVGTRVKFQHGLNWIEAEVVELMLCLPDQVEVRNVKSKTKRTIETYKLEVVKA